MLIDARQLANGSELASDVCIVGAGAAGITIARELVATPLTVCLLESGGFEPHRDIQALCQGENVGLPYYPLDANRWRAFGGTTGLWAGWCRPLDDIDFAHRPWVPHSGWPLAKADLLPFYARAHTLCELGPLSYDPEDWEEHYHLSRLPLAGTDVVTRIYQLSPPTRFGVAYRDVVARAANVQAVLHANVVQVEATESATAVNRLHVTTRGGARLTARARYYVLAAGGIENARLLLVSDTPQAAGLGNTYDLVGRYFMEHLHFSNGAIRFVQAQAASLALYVRATRRAVARLFPSEAAQEREGLLNCGFTLTPTYWSDRLGLTATLQRVAGGGRRFRQLLGRDDAPVQLPWRTRRVELHHTLEQAPNPESRVTLSDERDVFGVRRIRLDWRTSTLERYTAERVPRLLGDAFAHAGLGRLDTAPAFDAWPPPPLQGLRGHHLGTTRMHADPRCGVVDPQGRVHGIANLYVTGSSVFPTAGAGTPTLTIVALALRLADRLKGLAARPD